MHASIITSFIYATFRYIIHSDISHVEYYIKSKYDVYMYIYYKCKVVLRCACDSFEHKIDAHYIVSDLIFNSCFINTHANTEMLAAVGIKL